MTNQEKIQYLKRYNTINREIDRELEQRARWRARAEKMSAPISGMPAGGANGDHTQAAVEKICEIDRRIGLAIARLLAVKCEVELAISSVPDLRYREVLRRRYIDGDTFERIAVDLHYNYRWVKRLHGQALNQLAPLGPLNV